MFQPPSSWPFERPGLLDDALREQGATPEERADLLPAISRLAEWQAPQPEPAETRRLLLHLAAALPVSPVRQAIRAHQQRPRTSISRLLNTAWTQTSLFGLNFWLVSALITLLGALVSKAIPNQDLVLRASGPLLAYLGTLVAFRGREERVMELELVCLPSPLQLAMARLVIVLSYDLGLGLMLSLLLWASGSAQILSLTLSWLMPLFLVAGLALLLSLRLSMRLAAALAYAIWLTILACATLFQIQMLLLAPALLVLPGCIGLALLAIALLCIHTNMHHLLSHP